MQPALKLPPVAAIVHFDAQNCFFAALSVGSPPVSQIKTLSADVAIEHPEACFQKSKFRESRAAGLNQRHAKAASPVLGIEVERVHLAVVEQFAGARRTGGDKSEDLIALDGQDCMRFVGVARGEIVACGAIL